MGIAHGDCCDRRRNRTRKSVRCRGPDESVANARIVVTMPPRRRLRVGRAPPPSVIRRWPLFEMVTGRPPFRCASLGQLISAHMFEPPPLPTSFVSSVPADLESDQIDLCAKHGGLRLASRRPSDPVMPVRNPGAPPRSTMRDDGIAHRDGCD